MSEKTITIAATVIPKSLTEAEWSLEPNKNYVPAAGEKVLYARDENHDYVRVKYGDSENKVGDLSFADEYLLNAIPKKLASLEEDVNHETVTAEQKTAWDAKLDEEDIKDFVTTLENSQVKVENQESTSYGIEVPDKCLSYAKINTIGGMTRKCTNLLDLSTANFTSIHEGKVSVEGDVLTVTGYAVGIDIFDFKANETYTISTSSTRTGGAGGGISIIAADSSNNTV
jgi:hypothetical protein